MTTNLNELRTKVGLQRQKNMRISAMLGHWYARGLRHHFLKWKNQTTKDATVQEVNEQGPVVEDVL